MMVLNVANALRLLQDTDRLTQLLVGWRGRGCPVVSRSAKPTCLPARLQSHGGGAAALCSRAAGEAVQPSGCAA